MKLTKIMLTALTVIILVLSQSCGKRIPTSPVIEQTNTQTATQQAETNTSTPSASFTSTTLQASATATNTFFASSSATMTPQETATDSPALTSTETASVTSTLTDTPATTQTSTPTETDTFTASITGTPYLTETFTITVTLTVTETVTVTETEIYTSPTATETASPTCVIYGPEGFWHAINDTDPIVPPSKPAGSTSTLYWFGNPATGTYEAFDCEGNESTISGSLIIENIAVPAGGYLSFSSYEQTEMEDTPPPCDYDVRIVGVSEHGQNNWTFMQEIGGYENAWYNMTMDISGFAGMNVDVLFYFDTVDEVGNDFLGWMVDDINVFIPTPTATDTALPTDTNTPEDTATRTASPTPTITLTSTVTFTCTPSYTPTTFISATITQTHTVSPTVTITPLTIEYQNGMLPDASYADTEDTSINNYYPSRTNGICSANSAIDSGFYKYKSLIRFGMPGLPVGATIAGATLTIQANGYYNYSTPPYTLFGYRVTTQWTQRDLCGADTASNTYPTWTSSGFGTWTTPGGDFAEVSGVLTASGTGWPVMALSPSLIQGWLNGTYQNYGIMIAADTSKQGGFSWLSNEASSAFARPKLTVYYYLP